MAYRFDSRRDEVFTEGPLSTSGASGLLRVIGGWGNISGPSIFMLRTLVTGATTALSFGVFGASLSAFYFGTACIPFVVASSIGFVVGTVGFYRDCVTKSLLSLDMHPKLLRLHLEHAFPSHGFRGMRTEDFRSAIFSRSWTLKSMLIVGWLTAQPALDQIFEARERALIAQASEEVEQQALSIVEDKA